MRLQGLRQQWPQVRKFALANPEHAPYGRAAREAAVDGALEKGADLVLELAHSLPSHFELHVTGAGQLGEKFSAMSEARENFNFYGIVDEGTLYDVIACCDVIVNPHVSIAAMGNGVFPFKVRSKSRAMLTGD